MPTPEEHIKNSYEIARAVYNKQTLKTDGIKQLASMGFNEGSAKMILNQIFPEMMNGKRFTRTLSAPYFEYYLSNIIKDFGANKLSIVLSGLEKHIQYNNGIGNPKLKLKKLYSKYLLLLNVSTDSLEQDVKEQDEIDLHLKKTMSREQIIAELNSLKAVEPEIVIINNKQYKRDNKTIAQIKFIRGFKCQICNSSILKRDGRKYVEAAHIMEKHKTGPETPDNILILCPNHHKEFDLGNREIKKHTKDQVDFLLNGVSYSIILKVV